MARIDVTLNGRSYPINCDDGEEERVQQIAEYWQDRLEPVTRQAAGATDAHLLVISGLMLGDELFELRAEIGRLRDAVGERLESIDDSLGGELESLAARIEAIAGRLERA